MTNMSSTNDNDALLKELNEFRREWREEMGNKNKKHRQTIPSTSQDTDGGATSATSSKHPRYQPQHSTSYIPSNTESAFESASASQFSSDVGCIDHMRRVAFSGQNTALELYEKAVHHEQRGRFNEALIFYRAAFKADDGVEKLYRRKELELLNSGQEQLPEEEKVDEDDDFDLKFSALTMHHYPSTSAVHDGIFDLTTTDNFRQSLLSSFAANPLDLQQCWNDNKAIKNKSNADDATIEDHEEVDEEEKLGNSDASSITPYSSETSRRNSENAIPTSPFEMYPHDPEIPMYISRLPPECILCILNHLVDPNSPTSYPHVTYLERFARVCRLARILSLHVSIWSYMCQHVFTAPYQISTSESAYSLVSKQYGGDWRKMWIERPRIRSDGVYIARITYLRPGTVDSFGLMITYYRYLRFYSTGVVISLVSATPPDEIVRDLNLDLRAKGIAVGSWKLRRNKVVCFDLEDPARKRGDNKYSFVLEAVLKSTGRGRMTKMDIHKLSSYNRIDEELVEIPLANETNRAFFFSKVYAYEGR